MPVGKRKGHRLLNENSEIHGPCQHRVRFHRFKTVKNNTDELSKSEKGVILCKEIQVPAMIKPRREKKKSNPLAQIDPNIVVTRQVIDL